AHRVPAAAVRAADHGGAGRRSRQYPHRHRAPRLDPGLPPGAGAEPARAGAGVRRSRPRPGGRRGADRAAPPPAEPACAGDRGGHAGDPAGHLHRSGAQLPGHRDQAADPQLGTDGRGRRQRHSLLLAPRAVSGGDDRGDDGGVRAVGRRAARRPRPAGAGRVADGPWERTRDKRRRIVTQRLGRNGLLAIVSLGVACATLGIASDAPLGAAAVNSVGTSLPADAAPPSAQVLTLLGREGTYIDWSKTVQKSQWHPGLMSEPLVMQDINAEIKPLAAERWTISPDGRTWT